MYICSWIFVGEFGYRSLGVEVGMLKLLLLLYADDIVFFQNLQKAYKKVYKFKKTLVTNGKWL